MPSKRKQPAKSKVTTAKSKSKATSSAKAATTSTNKAAGNSKQVTKASEKAVAAETPTAKTEAKASATSAEIKETPKVTAAKVEKSAAKAEPKPEPKVAPKAEKKPEPVAKPMAEPKAAPAPKPEPKPATKTEPKPKAEAKPAVKSQPAAKAEPAPKAPEPKSAVKAPAEPEKAASKAEADPKAAAAAKPKVAEKPKPEPKPKPKAEKKPEPKPDAKPAEPKAEKPAKPAKEAPASAKPEAKEAPTAKAEVKEAPTAKAEAKPKPAEEPEAEATPKPEPKAASKPAAKPAPKAAPKAEPAPEPKKEVEPVSEVKPEPEKPEEPAAEAVPEPEPLPEPRRSVAFIGSECYPFVKTGGLGDVMYALPKALVKLNCDVKVILPRYACIKQEWQEKMVYKGAFNMDLCADGTSYYVGIMEYEQDGVVYDFIDNEWFFSAGNPYINLVDDIPKYCYFSKAALAALNYLNWIPDIIHCHDWQAALVPVYLKTMFQETPLARSKTVLTIHNLRFQGKYSMDHIKYWSGLPDYVFNEGALQENWTDANMLKGGLAYTDMISTVSGNYAREIQTPEYGEGLDAHLRYHSGKLRGIVNGIDIDIWNPKTDKLLDAPYDASDAIEQKKADKAFLQKELGLEEDPDKMVIGLISRLTNQKGLDLVNDIFQQMLDGNTQVVILGTGDHQYEDSFRWFENNNKGTVCSNIMYDEARSHQIYAGADALLVPSRFEPCGLTQLIAMHYGTIPIVRETGGLKDTVEPYNKYTNQGNGFSFDRYESGLLLDAINRAKTLFFTNRYNWDQMVVRDMEKDVSWNNSAKLYRDLYLELTA